MVVHDFDKEINAIPHCRAPSIPYTAVDTAMLTWVGGNRILWDALGEIGSNLAAVGKFGSLESDPTDAMDYNYVHWLAGSD